MTTDPKDPIAAASHPNPYPYYARLVRDLPLYRDGALGLWVTSSAEATTAALTDSLYTVRPAAEPVPRLLLGSPAAEVFRHLVRMTDGEGHCPLKGAVSATLALVDPAGAAREANGWADGLWAGTGPADAPGRLSSFVFELPAHVVGSLLGVPRDLLARTALWVGHFARCIAPGSDPGQIEKGKAAAGELLEMFRSLLADRRPVGGLLATLAGEAKRVGRGEGDAVAANAVGFLSQAHEATAGLVGNTLLALAARPELQRRVRADPGLLEGVVLEVLRFDPPVQNTRRFVARGGLLAGRRVEAGEAVLVLVAAANRDPSANPEPDRFDPFRPDRKTLAFGLGAHACPGEVLAPVIARAGVERVLASGIDLEGLAATATYRASANARVPLFGPAGEAA